MVQIPRYKLTDSKSWRKFSLCPLSPALIVVPIAMRIHAIGRAAALSCRVLGSVHPPALDGMGRHYSGRGLACCSRRARAARAPAAAAP